MWRSVGFLLFLLFFSSPAHDVKEIQFVEDDLHDISAQYYGQVSSCYRKGNPDKCNSFAVRSEIQIFRQILSTHSDKAASGPVVSVPSTYALGRSQDQPSMPGATLPRNRANKQAPVAMPPMSISSPPNRVPSESPMEKLKAPEVVPIAKHSPLGNKHDLKEPSVSPIASPTESTWKNARIPVTPPVYKSSSRHTPASGSVSSPQIIPTFVPSWKGIGYQSPINLPSEPQAAPPPILSPSRGHYQNMRGPAASYPNVFPVKSPIEKSTLPHLELPRNRSKRQAPAMLAPKNQGHYAAPASILYEPHTKYRPTPKLAPSITLHSPYYLDLQGPSVSPSERSQMKPSLPVANQPWKSLRHAPVTTLPLAQGPVSFPPVAPSPEQSVGNSRSTFAPSGIISSSSPYSGVKGHVTSPSNDHYRSPLEKPGIFLVPSPMIRSRWHAPTVTPPIDQGHFYTRPAHPPEQHKGNDGPTASPLMIASQPPQKLRSITRALPSDKRPWRHSPLAIPSVREGSIPSQFTAPLGPRKVISRAPASAPQIIVSLPHNWVVKGPVSSSPSIIPSRAAQRKPSIPVAAPPNIRLWNHAPVTSLPRFQGPASSPVKSLHPSSSANLRTPTVSPSIISPFSTHHQSRKDAPVGSPLMIQGPIQSSVRSPHPPSPGNLRTPTVSPSLIFPFHNQSQKHAQVATPPMIQGSVNSPVKSPHPSFSGKTPTVSPLIIFPSHNQSWKHAPVATPPMIQGSVNSPVISPHPSSSGNFRTPTASPSIIFTSHNRSRKHAPVATPPMIQGSVNPPIKSPQPSSSGNLRTPTVSPSIISRSHNRSRKHAPVATSPMIQGTVNSPVKSPHPSSPGNFITPTASPSIIFTLHNRSRKHAPVAMPPMIQGSVNSPIKSPQPSSSGNLRTPTVSPSIIFPSHNRSWKYAPVATSPMIQGSVNSPVKSPQPSSSGNFRTPTVSPSIIFSSPPHNRSWKHATVASPHIIQGPAYSPVKSRQFSPPHHLSQNHTTVGSPPVIHGTVYPPEISPYPQSSGNLGTPTAFPPIVIPNAPHHRSGKHATVARPPISKGDINSPAKSPYPSTPNQQSQNHTPVGSLPFIQGPVYSPKNPPNQPSSGSFRTPTASPSIVIPSPPHHRPWKQAPFRSPLTRVINSPAKSPHPSTPDQQSQNHTPVGSLPFFQGPVYSPESPPDQPSSGNLRTPTASPSIVISSPTHHRPWKQAPLASPPGNKGLINSPAKSPFPSTPDQQSQNHTPVGSLPFFQGPVYSPESPPDQPSSGNLRTPTASPSIVIFSPTHHRPWKQAPLASPPGNKGLINSPAKSPFPSTAHHRLENHTPVGSPLVIHRSQKHTPVGSPLAVHRSQKQTPVGSPPVIQGPVNSPEKSPYPPSSGNLRTPTGSPTIVIPSSPHHRSWKHAPVASPPNSKGLINSPAKSPHPSPRHHQSQKHTPFGSPSMIQGPGHSPEKSQYPPSSGNLRTPTASPSIANPPYHRSRKHAPVSSPPTSKGLINSPAKSPHSSPSENLRIPAASPSNNFPLSPHKGHAKGSLTSPNISPSEPSKKTSPPPVAPPPMIFPPPPPGLDCSSVICTVPYTSTPPGSPCGCVYPMQIELGLGVALYAFFPLVSELASEIAAGTFLKQSQVRIMGANAYSQDQEKTIVDIDLVPLGENFDNTTAFLIFDRFWQKKVMINETLFGDYWVIYINYPGLPQSPPSAYPNTTYNGVPNSDSNGSSKRDPLGVDVNKQSDKMGAGTIAVVALSSAIAMIICLGTVWIILFKCRNQNRQTSAVVEPTHVPSSAKRSATGGGSILSGSMGSSTSMSFASSMVTYTGSAKTFTSVELEKATDRFNPQNILGEGGFGRVYQGLLEDGTKVAVKVLTRDDQQGGREFIAEVEMLSRLHHRNLVKLIGICTEEHNRCLVYELIPNGSVESHLHGPDKEIAPLDWDARIKIALGAARGLAYLHEDSSPRVIHRDFKASNILLEDDFTPKVSDFGLAKSASEEVSGHISTRVMGTFGYVAPEYAMTGHLLVKSDVYSYGVVLLELLSGRKPVDMSQPPGQENLVTWARPLLTSKEGLETLVDPDLGSNLPFDNIARVAAIASMCVQPDHSHRPFMGEVVQALKLVYNDSDASNAGGSGSFSRGESSAHDTEVKDSSSQPWHHSMQYVPDSTSFVTIDYDSGPLETQGLEVERPLSASALMSNSGQLIRQLSGSFRRHSSSGPLRTNKSKETWYGIRGLERGSISEHGVKRHFDRGSDRDVHELWP